MNDPQQAPDGITRSKWREPVMWLVIGLPLAAIIFSAVLISSALRTATDDSVIDTVQRTGQAQTTDLGPDARAADLHLGAVVQLADGVLHVYPAGGDFARKAPLQLTLVHPLHKAADQTLVLAPDATGWHVDVDLDDRHDWIVHVTDTPRTWRLRGRLPKGQHAAHLGASLDVQ